MFLVWRTSCKGRKYANHDILTTQDTDGELDCQLQAKTCQNVNQNEVTLLEQIKFIDIQGYSFFDKLPVVIQKGDI